MYAGSKFNSIVWLLKEFITNQDNDNEDNQLQKCVYIKSNFDSGVNLT
jgi:hypothetical protein